MLQAGAPVRDIQEATNERTDKWNHKTKCCGVFSPLSPSPNSSFLSFSNQYMKTNKQTKHPDKPYKYTKNILNKQATLRKCYISDMF